MARTPISCSDNSTNTLEPLMHALYHLQRTPGCEEEAESIASKLREEFLSFPIKYDKNKQPYRLEEGIKYLPSGNILLPSYPGWTIAHIGGWDFEVEEPEQKKTRKKSVSFGFMRALNPIWYAQIQLRLKRKVSVDDYKIDIGKLLELKEIHDSLPEEERKMLDKVQGTVSSNKRKLHSYAEKMLEQTFKLIPGFGRWVHRANIGEPKHFFFLSDLECDTIIQHVQTHGEPETYYGYDAKPFTDMILAIIDGRPEERYYVLDADRKAFEFQEEVEISRWGNSYTETVTSLDAKAVYEYYLDQLADCSNEQLKVLKHLGIEIPKEDA